MALKNEALNRLLSKLEAFDDSMSVYKLFEKCDEAIEGEIAAIKAELTDANRYKDIYRNSSNSLRSAMFEKYNELRKANNQIDGLKNDLKMAEARIEAQKKTLDEERKHGEDLADVNGQLASENVDLKARLTFLEPSRITWRSRAHHAEEEVENLNEKISELEKENANLRVTPPDANAIEVLRGENEMLWSRIEELEEENINKRPWHGDANAITGAWTCCESLSETIEFQNKKIEELEAEKARLKEACDIQETTIKRLKLLLGKEHKENVDLSPGHEFEFGDEVFVPWSDAPYMYIKSGLMYNTRTERLVYVGKDQHLKWFGDKFSIV